MRLCNSVAVDVWSGSEGLGVEDREGKCDFYSWLLPAYIQIYTFHFFLLCHRN
jgi:hypothetical protein